MPAKKGGTRARAKAPPKKPSRTASAAAGAEAFRRHQPSPRVLTPKWEKKPAPKPAANRGVKSAEQYAKEAAEHAAKKKGTQAAGKVVGRVAGRAVGQAVSQAAGKVAVPMALAAQVGEHNKAAFKRKHGRAPRTPSERLEARYGVAAAPEKAPKRVVPVRKPTLTRKAGGVTKGRKRTR